MIDDLICQISHDFGSAIYDDKKKCEEHSFGVSIII